MENIINICRITSRKALEKNGTMPKIFRRIRQAVSPNYFAYAIGEILLVVLGILIALQINNWNESQKKREKEQEYLLALKEEFLVNLEELQKEIDLNNLLHQQTQQIIAYTGPGPYRIDLKIFTEKLALLIGNSNIYDPSTGVVQELINSGNLNGIRNSELKTKLAGWNVKLEFLRDQELTAESYRVNIKDLFIKKGNIVNALRVSGVNEQRNLGLEDSQFENDTRSLLRDIEFENNLGFKLMASRALDDRYTETKQEIEAILDLISKEILRSPTPW